MKLERLHLIKENNVYFAYYHLSLFVLSDLSFQILTSLKKGEDLQSIAQKNNISKSELLAKIQTFEKIFPDISDNQIYDNEVERITIHVANDCNLRCKYCYANGGNYNSDRGLMSIDTATQFVKFCVSNFKKIETIVFFGGEPLLNLPIIKLICQLFENYYKNRQINFVPRFGIVTNGTIINPSIISFIQQYISYITVSIDGNKLLNDANRVFANGTGSYDKIANFIRTVKQNTNIEISFEATFTNVHQKLKFSHSDISKMIQDEFNIQGVVIDELNLEQENKPSMYQYDYQSITNENFKSLPRLWGYILKALSNHKPLEMCSIGKRTFAVFTDGTIYPCHMKAGNKANNIGNINGDNIFNNPYIFSNAVEKLSLKDNEKCIHCWAKELCGGCAVSWFYNSNKNTFQKFPNETLCKQHLIEVDNALKTIGHLRTDKAQWTKFLTHIRNVS